MSKLSVLIFACLVLAALQLSAQTITGSISGRVFDPQGAAVANATVTAADPNKNFRQVTKTGEQGEFGFAALPPGNYTISVESTGFKRLDQTGLTLHAEDKLALGELRLELGAVNETVEVSSDAALLQTESVDRSATITGKQMENIEVNGRNPLEMTRLIPGVVENTNFQVGGTGGIGNIQVNGNRGSANMLTINGVDDLDTGSNGSQNVTVSLDATQEFKILTGIYQAEYGRNAGAQISIVTKSGTDQFHGSGYWYHRHDDLNANSWLNNAKGLPRSKFRYNDVGYTIGGPIFIPKLLRQTKDKLFFFVSEEWQEQLAPNSVRNVEVPTALERQGNFSQSVDSSGKPVTIKNPLTGLAFPNNTVPQNQMYAPGIALLNLFPLPNVTGQTGYNYSSQLPNGQNRREDMVRIDYTLRDNLRFWGHYINNSQPFVYPYGSFVLGINVPVVPIQYLNPGYSYAFGGTWLVNPTMTNEFNFGVSHNSIDIDETGNKLTRTTSGVNLPLLFPGAVQKDYIPGFTFAGSRITSSFAPVFTSVGDAPFVNYNTVLNWNDNLTMIAGSHTIKLGGFFERSRKNQTSFGNNNGQYNFGDTSANPYDTGYGFANAAVGVYQSFDQAQNYINGQYRYWNIEGFLQDTWKITPRITLDYGLRVQWYQPQFDASFQASTFVLSRWNPAKSPRLYQPAKINGVRSAYDPTTGQVLPAYDIGLEVPNSGDPFNGVVQSNDGINKYLQNDRGPQWGPRFGVAWDVTGRQSIVIRTGGGIYYDRFQGNRVFDMVRNPPEGLDPQLVYGFAQNINPNNVLLAPPNLYAADPTGKLPTTYDYQFDVQMRLPWSMMLDTAYVGGQSRHLQDNRNLNPVPYGATFLSQNQDSTLVASQPNALSGSNALPSNFLRPLRGFGQIQLYESAAVSNYNALQISASRHAAKGLFVGVAYTWSKTLTNATSDTAQVRADNLTRIADYAPANFDRRHVFAANYVYSLPNFQSNSRFVRAVTNGWQYSGVIAAATGSPFTPQFSISGVSSQNITGNAIASTPFESARLGYVQGCDPYTGKGDPWNRLNTACFTAPQPGSLGLESGLNWLHYPGYIDFDMSLQKEFSVAEKLKLQFRADAFNIFNHANFIYLNSTLNFTGSYPNGLTVANNPYSSTGALVNQNGFGTVAAPAGTSNTNGAGTPSVANPRILQLVIRLQF
jgi:Carboxypeptidase regulatory-like domain/TonB-dependent Receptor Plug Domain